MALNPYFLQGSPGEQSLVQDLINEQLKIYGIEVYYLPRKIFKTDNIPKKLGMPATTKATNITNIFLMLFTSF